MPFLATPLTIPWFRLEGWHPFPPPLDWLPLQPFGFLVAAGVLLGARLAERWGVRNGIKPHVIADLITHVLITGFISAMALNVVFYEPHKLLDPEELFSTWPGLSSFGGFFGAVVGLFIWKKRRHMPALPIADAIAFGLPLGWMFGRTGCFVVKDHPGKPTDFFLGVENYYESGITRHDLGFYEILWSVAAVIVFLILGRKPNRRPGFYVALCPILYTPIRFFLDFLRAPPEDNGDVRYFGFTPGQYASVALLAVGIYLMWRIHAHPVEVPKAALLGPAETESRKGPKPIVKKAKS